MNVDLREAQRRLSKRVHRSFSHTDAPLGVRSGGAQRTWLRVLNSRCTECQKLVSVFLSGCFSMLILLPIAQKLKASIALIQPSTPPRLSYMKNNYKISGKKKFSEVSSVCLDVK